MPKIKASKVTGLRHETKATLSYPDDDGQLRTGEFRIIFRGMSPATARALAEAQLEGDEPRVEKAKYLAAAVIEMPEIVGDDDLPVPITVEFFDYMDFENLSAIFTAVTEGYSPPESTSEASPDT